MLCELLALADDGCPIHAGDPDPDVLVFAACWVRSVPSPTATPPDLIGFDVSPMDHDRPVCIAAVPGGDSCGLMFRPTGPQEQTYPGFKVYGIGPFKADTAARPLWIGGDVMHGFSMRLADAVWLLNRLAFFGWSITDAAGRFAHAQRTVEIPATVADLYPVSLAAAWDAMHEVAEGR